MEDISFSHPTNAFSTSQLLTPKHNRVHLPQVKSFGGECVRGSIHVRHGIKNPWYYIKFNYEGRQWEVSRYRGQRMYDHAIAVKLLHQMQGEVENGTFNPLKYTKGETNVNIFLQEWLEECGFNWSPGTRALYKSYIVNHLEPFFKEKPYQLNEIKVKQYQELKTHLEKKTKKITGQDGEDKVIPVMQPEYVKKVVDCLRSAMSYAFECEIVGAPPPKIRKDIYQIPDREINVITEELQIKIIKRIPVEHQAIYWFMKYHPMVRPANAMMLMIQDYDPIDDVFIIGRGISAGNEVEYTKTKKILVQPCHPAFKPIMADLMRSRAYPFSPFIFTCKESRHKHKRYTKEILNSRWNEAARAEGANIDLYHGTRHTTITTYVNMLTPEQTKLLAGHTTVSTTLKYYGKVNIETQRKLLTANVITLTGTANTPRRSSGVN